jgi:hypothetical protein
MGTTKGGHIFIEAPDVSSNLTARMDGVTIMDGSYVMQGDWAPLDYGKFPYVAGEQPWSLEVYTGLDPQVAHDIRVYVSSYSDEVDTPLVRYGSPGATPSVVVTVPALTQAKPNSGSNVTPWLVTGISAVVGSAVTVAGKLRRPITVTVDLSGLSAHRPTNWAYQLIGYVNGDVDNGAFCASGYLTQDGDIPSGPDGLSTLHTFLPEEPTAATSVTIYAVAGIITGDNYVPRRTGNTPPGTFLPNNIVPGITASCVISLGTTTGVLDMAAVWLASTSAEFHVDPVTGKFSMDLIDFTKAKPGTFSSEFTSGAGSPLTMSIVDLLKASNFEAAEFEKAGGVLTIKALAADKIKTGVLEVGGADTGGDRVSRFKVFDTTTPTANLIGWIGDDSAASGFVGAWFKRILIGGTSPATAKIVADSSGNVSISGTLIAGNISGNAANITGTLTVSQLGSGTLPVGVVYAGTVLCSQLGSGTLPVGVVYAGTVLCSQLGSGTLPVGVVYAGTVLCSQLGSGTLPVGVVYAGTVLCSQLGSGTLPVGVVYAGSLDLTSGSMNLKVNTTDGFLYTNSGLRVQIVQDSSIMTNAGFNVSDGGSAVALLIPGIIYANTASGQSAACSIKGGTIGTGGLYGASNIQLIKNLRQTGPGTPSFSTLSDAQTWCQNLYNSLKVTTGHGLIT